MGIQRWMNFINKSLHRNHDTHNSNFVLSPPPNRNHLYVHELMFIDIFPFFNFANHNSHGVDVSKYINALPEEEREKIVAGRKEKEQRVMDAIQKLVDGKKESEEK